MSHTTITVKSETLDDFHNTKEELYGDLASEVSNERFLQDLLELARSEEDTIIVEPKRITEMEV